MDYKDCVNFKNGECQDNGCPLENKFLCCCFCNWTSCPDRCEFAKGKDEK